MLRVNNLSCGYLDKLVLKEINLSVNRQELVGIIGPNGSGKTTLLRAITRIIRPKSGAILLEGKDIWQISLKELAKKIAVVSQNFSAGAMSIEEFVLLGRIPHLSRLQFWEGEKDLAAAEKSMRLTDTFRLKHRLINETSGGERQLAALARALAQEPQLLLLDEPTAHLDIAHQVGILDLVKKLNRELGLSVIMVLHDLNLASLYCERLVLLHNGRLYKQGPPEEVLTYQTIEQVYRTVVIVKQSPLTGKPYIFLTPRA